LYVSSTSQKWYTTLQLVKGMLTEHILFKPNAEYTPDRQRNRDLPIFVSNIIDT